MNRRVGKIVLALLFLVCAFADGQTQQWLWGKEITTPYNLLHSTQISVDQNSGDIFLSSSKWDQNYGLPAGSNIIKYDSNGNQLWNNLYNWQVRILSIQSDNQGNLIVAGDFKDTIKINGIVYASKGVDAFICNVNAAGSITWFKHMTGPGDENASHIHLSGDGYVFVTGQFSDQTTIDGLNLSTNGISSSYILRCDLSGTISKIITTQNIDSAGVNNGLRVQTDIFGNIYMLGGYGQIKIDTTTLVEYSPYGAQYLAKFDSSGQFVFLKSVNTFTNKFHNFKVGIDGIYCTGGGGWTSGGWCMTKKYSFSGNVVWAKQHSGFYYSYSSNNIISNGSGYYTIGQETNPNVPQWIDTHSLMICEYDVSGQENCTFIISKGWVNGLDIDQTNPSEFLILGFTPDTLVLGGITLKKNKGNLFIAKFRKQNTVTSVPTFNISEEVTVIPNPSEEKFLVHLKKPLENARLCIYDATGKCIVVENAANMTDIQLDLTGHAHGIYFMEVSNVTSRIATKIIKN